MSKRHGDTINSHAPKNKPSDCPTPNNQHSTPKGNTYTNKSCNTQKSTYQCVTDDRKLVLKANVDKDSPCVLGHGRHVLRDILLVGGQESVGLVFGLILAEVHVHLVDGPNCCHHIELRDALENARVKVVAIVLGKRHLGGENELKRVASTPGQERQKVLDI